MVVDMGEMNLSFAGCGYLGIYHLGAATCFRKHAPRVFDNKIAGASVGALVASAYLCDVPIATCAKGILKVAMKTRSGYLGALKPENKIMKMLYENMYAMLPDDAHIRCNGKLFISATRRVDCKNVLLSQFETKKDLVKALMCSCYIPVYCGNVYPKYQGEEYMDGGCSDNMPLLDENTICVSPLYGESDIHPSKNGYIWKSLKFSNNVIYITIENLKRALRILCPGTPNMLHKLCQEGYNDALTYLRINGIIPCPNCKEPDDVTNGYHNPEHLNCRPMHENLPSEILHEFEIARKKESHFDRLCEFRLIKLFYLANTPSIAFGQWSIFFLKMFLKSLNQHVATCAGNMRDDILNIIKQHTHDVLCYSHYMILSTNSD